MTGKRTRYSAQFKARVALEALRGELTAAQLAAKHGIHQTMVGEWKRQAMEGMVAVFPAGRRRIAAGPLRPRSRSCMPRSASCWWNGIFWRKCPVDEPGVAAPDD